MFAIKIEITQTQRANLAWLECALAGRKARELRSDLAVVMAKIESYDKRGDAFAAKMAAQLIRRSINMRYELDQLEDLADRIR